MSDKPFLTYRQQLKRIKDKRILVADDDFVLDTEFTYNENDKVSVKVDPSKIKIRLKGDIANYEI